MPVRVVIADSHPVWRLLVREMLQDNLGIEVIGEACNGQAAVALALTLQPDVVLMGYNLWELNGVEATKQILDRIPRMKILGVSADSEHEQQMRQAGAMAFINKYDCSEELLLPMVKELAEGQK